MPPGPGTMARPAPPARSCSSAGPPASLLRLPPGPRPRPLPRLAPALAPPAQPGVGVGPPGLLRRSPGSPQRWRRNARGAEPAQAGPGWSVEAQPGPRGSQAFLAPGPARGQAWACGLARCPDVGRAPGQEVRGTGPPGPHRAAAAGSGSASSWPRSRRAAPPGWGRAGPSAGRDRRRPRRCGSGEPWPGPGLQWAQVKAVCGPPTPSTLAGWRPSLPCAPQTPGASRKRRGHGQLRAWAAGGREPRVPPPDRQRVDGGRWGGASGPGLPWGSPAWGPQGPAAYLRASSPRGCSRWAERGRPRARWRETGAAAVRGRG